MAGYLATGAQSLYGLRMSVRDEFATVDLLLASNHETRGVDAFALSVIKSERQIRKLFTYLAYQFPAFGPADVPVLRQTLGANKRVYFAGFMAGIDALWHRTVQQLVGAEYGRLKARLDESIDHRNKIFHGQLTARSLTRSDLTSLVNDLKGWCTALAAGAEGDFGYDGFGRMSFRKSADPDLSKAYRVQLAGVVDYQAFIHARMER
jgi:hypothetical protein